MSENQKARARLFAKLSESMNKLEESFSNEEIVQGMSIKRTAALNSVTLLTNVLTAQSLASIADSLERLVDSVEEKSS